jgi:hypothetical protein
MKLFKRWERVLTTDYSIDDVTKILEKEMNLIADGPYLFEKEKIIYIANIYPALMECWLYRNENKTLIKVRFHQRLKAKGNYIVTALIGLISIIMSIATWDYKLLLGIVPFGIIYSIGLLVFTIQKAIKMEAIERLLRCPERY